ncbi:MAG: hypothetical protein RLZZ600_1157 [Actinomycetota bacterium]
MATPKKTVETHVPERMSRRAANRWPAFIAIIVMLVIYAVTPQNMVPRAVMIVIASLIFIALIAINPVKTGRQSTISRWLAIALALLLMVSNLVDVVFIVGDLIAGRGLGPIILLEAFEVWVANVIAFSIVYWEIDRGGPVGRATLLRSQLPAADFKFPQDDERAAAIEVSKDSSTSRANWRPGYIDFLYMALTNMMAFTPNDVVPLTARAKIFMGIQGLSGFVILALVIGRSVNILA